MVIEKNGIVYSVKENEKSWTLSASIGGVSISYKVSKNDCPDFDSLKIFMMEYDTM